MGVLGTFSVWDSADALEDFAYRSTEHVRAIRRTRELGWYAEQLFARFEVLEAEGSVGGVALAAVA